MSTKKIKEALDMMQHWADRHDDDGAWNLALTAKAEVEAIERAAKDAVERNRRKSINHAPPALWELLESIAKEAP